MYTIFHVLYLVMNIPVLFFGLLTQLLHNDNYYVYQYYNWSLRTLYESFFTLEIINEDHYNAVFDKQRYLYVMNHQTYDAYLVTLSTQKVSCCIRSWSIYIPVIGQLWYLLDFVFIKNGKDTVRSIIHKLSSANSLSLAIFPEGTRNSDCIFRPDKVKSGAFIIAKELNLPLMPFYHTLGECINDTTKTIHFGKKIKIMVGKPIYPANKTIEEIKHEFCSQIIELEKLVKRHDLCE